jgi:prepilin-type N-terminal cleavage/methylation domain-containing protein
MKRSNANPTLHRRRSAAFTLIEMIASLVIMSILMVAMGGALMMSSQAVPDAGNRTMRITEAADVLDQITSELTYAIAVTEMTATAVTFTVADRDSDSVVETIRYAWSGTAGDPLTREYNGGAAVNVLEDVQSFDLNWSLRTEEGPPPPPVEGPEQEFSSFDGAAAWSDLTETDWLGQYFQPSLPADALAWRVSRVIVRASRHGGPAGIAKVQLRPADASNLPTSTVLEEQLFYESSLGAVDTWNEFTFTTVTGRSPGEGLCLVLEWRADAMFIYHNDSTPAGLLTTTDSGVTWNEHDSRVLKHYIYGHVTTPDPAPPPTESFLLSIGITLEAGTDPTVRLQTAARVLNEPEVTP